jgi:hypothetical protein
MPGIRSPTLAPPSQLRDDHKRPRALINNPDCHVTRDHLKRWPDHCAAADPAVA